MGNSKRAKNKRKNNNTCLSLKVAAMFGHWDTKFFSVDERLKECFLAFSALIKDKLKLYKDPSLKIDVII